MRILFVFFFLPLSILSQVSISGKVLSDESGEAVSGASVYINNSTIGISSNATGEYLLSGIFPGTYEIIVSHVSYEALVHRVEVGSSGLKFTFRLVGKVKMMRNILIMTKDQRKAKMKIFREQFLGITEAAERSVITNEEDILFEADEKPSSFSAFSEVPLIIINKETGYRISFDLKEFNIDMDFGQTYFYGFTRYEDLEKGNSQKWLKMRKRYYVGSTMHLYRSMSNGDSENEGFRFFRVGKMNTDGKGTTAKIMSPIPSSSLLFIDSAIQKKYLDWEGDIIVQFNKDPYTKRSLSRKVFLQNSLPQGIQTTISMLEAPAYLDANGVLENPLAVQYSGFWGYEKLASMLPVNFWPTGEY